MGLLTAAEVEEQLRSAGKVVLAPRRRDEGRMPGPYVVSVLSNDEAQTLLDSGIRSQAVRNSFTRSATEVAFRTAYVGSVAETLEERVRAMKKGEPIPWTDSPSVSPTLLAPNAEKYRMAVVNAVAGRSASGTCGRLVDDEMSRTGVLINPELLRGTFQSLASSPDNECHFAVRKLAYSILGLGAFTWIDKWRTADARTDTARSLAVLELSPSEASSRERFDSFESSRYAFGDWWTSVQMPALVSAEELVVAVPESDPDYESALAFAREAVLYRQKLAPSLDVASRRGLSVQEAVLQAADVDAVYSSFVLNRYVFLLTQFAAR